MTEIEYFYCAHSAFAYLGSARFMTIAKAAGPPHRTPIDRSYTRNCRIRLGAVRQAQQGACRLFLRPRDRALERGARRADQNRHPDPPRQRPGAGKRHADRRPRPRDRYRRFGACDIGSALARRRRSRRPADPGFDRPLRRRRPGFSARSRRRRRCNKFTGQIPRRRSVALCSARRPMWSTATCSTARIVWRWSSAHCAGPMSRHGRRLAQLEIALSLA
jgi:hypothetical protein